MLLKFDKKAFRIIIIVKTKLYKNVFVQIDFDSNQICNTVKIAQDISAI